MTLRFFSASILATFLVAAAACGGDPASAPQSDTGSDEGEEDGASDGDDDEPSGGASRSDSGTKPAGTKTDAGGAKADSGAKSDAASVEVEPSDGGGLRTDAGGGGGGGTGTCCPDGACVCRGDDPSETTLDKNGPYQVAKYTSGFKKPTDYGGGTIYYPTDAKPPLSVVVMCPGYTAMQSSIAEWGPFFASHGIVLMTMDTITTGDQVPQRAKGLVDAVETVKAENTRSGSPLEGKLSADRYGVSGWSMGGGGTWIASVQHPEYKSAVTLAGHNATAGGGMVAAGSKVPTLELNGADDTSVLGGQGQSENAYKAIPATTPKLMYIMSGEGHFSWGTPTTNGNASGRYVMAWEKTFLEGDTRYRKFLLVKGPKAATWESNVQ